MVVNGDSQADDSGQNDSLLALIRMQCLTLCSFWTDESCFSSFELRTLVGDDVSF